MREISGYIHDETLRYHPEHIWLRELGDNLVEIGLTDFYQKLAGKIEYIDLPEVGDDITSGERIGTIGTGKWLGKLIAPATGHIEEVNPLIEDMPEIVNKSPYEQGWLARIRLSNSDELRTLLFGKDAEIWLEGEIKKHAG